MKTTDCPFYLDDDAFQKLVDGYMADNVHRIRAPESRRKHPRLIFAFRRWLLARDDPALDMDTATDWMTERTRTAEILTVQANAIMIAGFCQYLVETGRMDVNPFQMLRDRHRFDGYRGIARMLKESGGADVLKEKADIPLSGPLAPSFSEYLEYMEGLGRNNAVPRRKLASFERHLRHEEIVELRQITTAHIERWQASFPPSSEARYRLMVLRGYFNYLLARGDITSTPMPKEIPYCRRRSRLPYIFRREEISAILTAAAELPDHRLLPYRGPTYRTVFLLLYTLGLRISEALRLRLRDLDFVENSVTIVETKFNKGRVLPMGPNTAAALKDYIDQHPLLRSRGKDAFLFPSDSHRTPHLQANSCFYLLKRLVGQLGISASPETRSPNHHSFRHSFAVHRVERWYREGAELGTKLPLLSAFMGHADVADTEVYLTMTPARLRLAGERFEREYGSRLADEEERP